MDRALTALHDEFQAAGKQDPFDQLKPWLVGEAGNLRAEGTGPRNWDDQNS